MCLKLSMFAQTYFVTKMKLRYKMSMWSQNKLSVTGTKLEQLKNKTTKSNLINNDSLIRNHYNY